MSLIGLIYKIFKIHLTFIVEIQPKIRLKWLYKILGST